MRTISAPFRAELLLFLQVLGSGLLLCQRLGRRLHPFPVPVQCGADGPVSGLMGLGHLEEVQPA